MESVELNKKIALGILTCDCETSYVELIKNIPYDEVDQVYVYDLSKHSKYVRHSKKIKPLSGRSSDDTVAVAKNRLIKRMINDGHEHLFIMNESVGFTNKASGVFDEYIKTSRDFGILGGMSFAWQHENVERTTQIPIIKNYIDGHDGTGIVFTHHKNTNFEYFHKDVIEEVGYFDESFGNCWESFDYYKSLMEARRTSLWWWFVDIKNSKKYLKNVNAPITYVPSGVAKLASKKQIDDGLNHFIEKWGVSPIKYPHKNEYDVLSCIAYLIEHYGRSNQPIISQETSITGTPLR